MLMSAYNADLRKSRRTSRIVAHTIYCRLATRGINSPRRMHSESGRAVSSQLLSSDKGTRGNIPLDWPGDFGLHRRKRREKILRVLVSEC